MTQRIVHREPSQRERAQPTTRHGLDTPDLARVLAIHALATAAGYDTFWRESDGPCWYVEVWCSGEQWRELLRVTSRRRW
jgi:hypothetical protein